VDLSKFTRQELILAGVALLLAIDLLFLPWFDISVNGFGVFTVSVTSTGTGSPNGWLGVLAVVTALTLIADLALERLAGAGLPPIGGSRATTRLALAVASAVCVGLKFLLHVHFDWFGGGFWGAAVLAVALVVLATRIRDAERATGSTGPRTVTR
jgi:hypothetical protein